MPAAPLADVTLHAVVGAFVTLAAQQLEQAPRCQPLARRPLAVRLQQRVEPSDKGPQPRLRLHLPLVMKLRSRAADRLANRLPRDPQLAHDLADRLLINQERPPDPANRFHRHHPRPRSPKQPGGAFDDSQGGSLFSADHPKSRVILPRCFPSMSAHQSRVSWRSAATAAS